MALQLHVRLNLFKLRNCRNIAGLVRAVDPYGAPTDVQSGLPFVGGGTIVLPGVPTLRPTAYRYATLIERAKQLVQLAGQVETSFLSTLEKRDAEAYGLLKARQDVRLAGAQVQLQDLRVTEALDGATLASLQQVRAQIQVDHYQGLLDAGLSGWEQAGLAFQTAAVVHLHVAAALKEVETLGLGGIGDVGNALAATASLLQTQASYERRSQEWEFQRDLSNQDVRIGQQQGQIAQDHVVAARQERAIARLQAENAHAVVDFLANKFTNVELYDWMSGVLEGIYRFFLQQAAVIAQLAANQLAFERQEIPPSFIQADYWQPPAAGGSIVSNGPDRLGLTGSARLLQDIYQLDQYAFLTNTRKLQLTKTISLAQLSPAEFQRFRESGVMPFATPMALFDRDFPGHYMRLIRRLRTSMVALIPPNLGIRATLTTNGISWVIIGPDVFQRVLVRRDPQSVALSAPRDAVGVFELDPQSELLLPFEGLGVDTAWELRMPKAANLFDYTTLADVLITIDYTALDSFDYHQQVIRDLDRTVIADRPFSFRNELADQWYDLHNPDQTATPMIVHFSTRPVDFAPNLDKLVVKAVVLYFARADGQTFEIQVDHLLFAEQGSGAPVGGGATTIDGIISTRKGNASSWVPMLSKSPFGEWDLALPDTDEMRKRFNYEEITDILFVITYAARTPEWPA